MNREEMEAKVKKVLSDEKYVKTLLEMNTAEEVQTSLKEKGLDISIEELNRLNEMFQRINDGELSDDELERVAGGVVWEIALFVMIGASLGSCGGALLGMGIDSAIRRRW